jgi:hypothetical protein
MALDPDTPMIDPNAAATATISAARIAGAVRRLGGLAVGSAGDGLGPVGARTLRNCSASGRLTRLRRTRSRGIRRNVSDRRIGKILRNRFTN